MRFARLFFFHFKQYVQDQYFFWLAITSTASIFLLQYVVAYAHNGLNDPTIWIKSGIFGLWASTTTSAGSIGFQRFQGTLPYIINTQYDERASLVALLLPASIYGLVAFPLASFMAKILQVSTDGLSLALISIVFLLWLAATVMSILIAAFFTLTPNAIVYEDLVNVPLLLLAGVFGGAIFLTPIQGIARWLIPITVPVKALTQSVSQLDGLAFVVSFLLWCGLILILARRINQLARQKGTLKII